MNEQGLNEVVKGQKLLGVTKVVRLHPEMI